MIMRRDTVGKGAHSILGKSILGIFLGKLSSCLFRLLHDRKGQDLIEYALLAAFMTVAAAAVMPTNIQSTTSVIFSRINVGLVASGSQGS